MLSAIKFGTAQFLTSNPPANTVCLALDFDDKKLYMITSEHKVLLSELMTAHLLDENGKIKQEYLDNGSVVEVPTKTSQLENDSGFIAKDTKSLKYYLTKDETLAEINKSVVSLTKDMDRNVAYLNTKIEQEAIKLQRQIDGLSGSYVYIGKIDNVNPTQDELTQAATQIKGEIKVGYVIVDGSQREWYFDGSVWNDFGTASSEITWDAIQDKPKLVEYTQYPEQNKIASITLTNHNSLFGTDTSGSIYNLAMVSKWNVADFGSASLHLNLNTVDTITVNDDKVIATVDQLPDMTNVVRYQNLGEYKKESLLLKNDQALFGTDDKGTQYNLAMVSRWNKADFGSASLELNLNAKDGIVTINDDKVVATVDQVQSVAEEVATTVVEEKVGTEEDYNNTINAINALTDKINAI